MREPWEVLHLSAGHRAMQSTACCMGLSSPKLREQLQNNEMTSAKVYQPFNQPPKISRLLWTSSCKKWFWFIFPPVLIIMINWRMWWSQVLLLAFEIQNQHLLQDDPNLYYFGWKWWKWNYCCWGEIRKSLEMHFGKRGKLGRHNLFQSCLGLRSVFKVHKIQGLMKKDGNCGFEDG